MIEQVSGRIIATSGRHITIAVNGLGLLVATPRPQELPSTEFTLYTHFHWSQDRGPAIYGFASQLERQTFLLLIDCHKIGPQIALNILSQVDALALLELCATSQERQLSNLNGIGPKKAEQLVRELHDKAADLLAMSPKPTAMTSHLRDVSDALKSLGYSPQEISAAMRFAQANAPSQAFDVVMRSALGYLGKTG
jgi:holliday junction DNA helicase RuvA